jgi:hypothetical protein
MNRKRRGASCARICGFGRVASEGEIRAHKPHIWGICTCPPCAIIPHHDPASSRARNIYGRGRRKTAHRSIAPKGGGAAGRAGDEWQTTQARYAGGTALARSTARTGKRQPARAPDRPPKRPRALPDDHPPECRACGNFATLVRCDRIRAGNRTVSTGAITIRYTPGRTLSRAGKSAGTGARRVPGGVSPPEQQRIRSMAGGTARMAAATHSARRAGACRGAARARSSGHNG